MFPPYLPHVTFAVVHAVMLHVLCWLLSWQISDERSAILYLALIIMPEVSMCGIVHLPTVLLSDLLWCRHHYGALAGVTQVHSHPLPSPQLQA